MTNDFEVSFTDKVWDCHVLEPQAVVDGWVVDSFIGVGGFGAVTGKILDAVHGMVHGRPDEVVHAGVHNGETLGHAFLHE